MKKKVTPALRSVGNTTSGLKLNLMPWLVLSLLVAYISYVFFPTDEKDRVVLPDVDPENYPTSNPYAVSDEIIFRQVGCSSSDFVGMNDVEIKTFLQEMQALQRNITKFLPWVVGNPKFLELVFQAPALFIYGVPAHVMDSEEKSRREGCYSPLHHRIDLRVEKGLATSTKLPFTLANEFWHASVSATNRKKLSPPYTIFDRKKLMLPFLNINGAIDTVQRDQFADAISRGQQRLKILSDLLSKPTSDWSEQEQRHYNAIMHITQCYSPFTFELSLSTTTYKQLKKSNEVVTEGNKIIRIKAGTVLPGGGIMPHTAYALKKRGNTLHYSFTPEAPSAYERAQGFVRDAVKFMQQIETLSIYQEKEYSAMCGSCPS